MVQRAQESSFQPPIYATAYDQPLGDYPVFSSEIGSFCEEVDAVADSVIHRSRDFSINDFIPKIKVRMFAVFGIGGGRQSNQMDGAGRAVTIVFGGLVAAISAFIFGSFYSDYQEACLRQDRCAGFKERFGCVWAIRGHEHINHIKAVVDGELKMALSEKRSAQVNIALVVGVIASSALLVVAGLFASTPLALGATAGIVTGIVLAMMKFGINFFDRTPIREAEKIQKSITKLKDAQGPLSTSADPFPIQKSA